MVSVHDNEVYSHVVDYEECRIVLHTYYPPAVSPEFTDIVFSGVVAHHFEYQGFKTSGAPGNILFDVVESPLATVLGKYSELLAVAKNYSWPLLNYDGPDDLSVRLSSKNVRCYEVISSCGLCGFVLASSMEYQHRETRAQVGIG